MAQLTLDDLQTAADIRHSWGGLSHLTGVLIWERYGYDSKDCNPPDWYADELALAKRVAQIVKPADCRWEVINIKSGGCGTYNGTHMDVSGTFRVWDEANPWCEPWEVNFLHSTEERARKDYADEFANLSNLHTGVIDALLHYQATGEPAQPVWMPKTKHNFHWLQPDYKRSEHLPPVAVNPYREVGQ